MCANYINFKVFKYDRSSDYNLNEYHLFSEEDTDFASSTNDTFFLWL